MIENLGRKITLIASLLSIAVLAMFVGGFRLGLDLQGGTRLEYRIPIDEAVASGSITEAEAADPSALIEDIIAIIRKRVDPTGVREPLVRAEGQDRIVIELPGTDSEVRENVVAELAEDLGRDARIITLEAPPDVLTRFPTTGGTVEIGQENAYYTSRDGARLRGVTRGQGTEKLAHEAGSQVRLINADPWRTLIENVGDMRFYIRATPNDFAGEGTDETTERRRVEKWIAENPGEPIGAYNRLAYTGDDTGGPWTRLRWYPFPDDGRPLEQRIQPLIIEQDERFRFEGDDLKNVHRSSDQLGYPAVGFEMAESAKARFTEYTKEHVNEAMAIVINNEIVTMPRINSTLPGSGIIEGGTGGFEQEEVQDLITVLRSGSLKIRPILEHQERVGATLGTQYVVRGAFSVVLGLISVLAFILWFYRRLGLFAALSLLANLVLMMGALAFLQATLTLPGVAGIILTVGMAVDANILIYERIREEAARGRKPLQAAKDGFGNALSTIVDSNLTTLITAIILYNLGSGPVRGFATTLSIGILTSMFSALVITRMLVHLQLEKGIDAWRMRSMLATTHIPFMRYAKRAMSISAVAIVAGLALFLWLPDKQKLGIDFLGGVTMTVRTESPMSVADVRSRVRGISGVIGSSSEVKEIQSAEADGGYTQFRITFKTPGAETQDADDQAIKDNVEAEVRDALADVLQRGPYEVRLESETGAAEGTLYFEEPHHEPDVVARLESTGLSKVAVEAVEGPLAAWSFTGQAAPERSEQGLRDLIATAFDGKKDARGRTFAWSSPVPEVAVVGAQVVSELRNDAIKAVLLSLFAAVMYIRFRFAEYSYGLAAVLALVHDVAITLGALAVALLTGLIEAEISLSMIAAFMTIIGYSLNDTIVIFDRVRENRPRMKGSLAEIIDTAINQTLSRTVLTTMTTLFSVILLFLFNFGSRNVLEGFSFALLVGMVAGTYSTVFIAGPALLWLENRRMAREEREKAKEKGLQAHAHTS